MPNKRKGKHPHNALTSARIKSLSNPGRYADGNGLYLVVEPSGAKRWILRTVVKGKRTDIGLGGLSLVPLKDAREMAAEYRRLARAGGDPRADRDRKNRSVPTFREAAERTHKLNAPNWRNEKHRAQWLSTLETYAYPVLGKRPVDDIDASEVLRVLSPIWNEKPETARRVRQRISTVMDWSKASGHRTRENPVPDASIALPKQVQSGKHFAALPFEVVPDFLAKLQGSEEHFGEVVRLALEFTVLTAARSGEVRGAVWSEIDEANEVWTIPGDRMKGRKEHRVPLSPRAIEIIQRARKLSDGSDYLFPGRTLTKPLSDMSLTMVLRRLKIDATVHGFRSSFRDWAAEKTRYPREAAEAALAHFVKDRVEAAYRRGDLFEKRTSLMRDWALFCASAGTEADQRVVQMPFVQQRLRFSLARNRENVS
ncbi:MAG: tyrosine-type recombinase/integrase [Alphaproteobacteria bacterium]